MAADMSTETQPGPEAWLAARFAAGKPAESWKPMARVGRCAFTGYEVSDTGCARSLPRLGRNGRPLEGGPVSIRPHGDYFKLDMRCDNPDCKTAHTFTAQKVVLWTFGGPRPHGKQASHLHEHPEWNWYPENLAWEDQPTNERRKTDRPPPPEPANPCRNAVDGCPNLVITEGRRCLDCVAEAGRQMADMLRDRRPLQEVADRFGYTTLDWPYKLAVQYGGYTGTKVEARTQKPPLKGWRATAARLLRVA